MIGVEAVITLVLFLLAGGVPVPPPPSEPQSASFAEPGYAETGMASWYGHPFHGRPAASGEVYDMETLVAAHCTLPFNTWVRVVNLDNSKSVEVRIIDRGPFIGGRIIDLSHAAAQLIDMESSGVAVVRMNVIRTPENAPAAIFAVQVGAFRVRANANRTRAAMASRYGAARLTERLEDPGMWRVMVGSETTLEGAQALLNRISQEIETKAFVVRLN